MIVYRITNHRSLDGKGATKLLNNRWNSYGTRMLYTAESIAVAKGEISRRTPLNLLPPGFEILAIEIPDNSIIKPEKLPPNWDEVPAGNATKKFGDDFVKATKALAMRIPSVYDKGSFNYIINPDHPDFAKVKLVSVEKLYF